MSEDQATQEIIEVSIDNMDADAIRTELKDSGVDLHHKTGIQKLKETLVQVRAGTYGQPETIAPQPVNPKITSNTGPTEAAKKAAAAHTERINNPTKEERALALKRIIVVPNDTNLSEYHGMIFTVGSSAVKKGKMVKKYVPFNNEQGWHVPNMIVENIQAAEVQKFRKETMPNGEKIMKPYMTKKFNVTILPDLTKQEMDELAAAQKARGGL